MQCMQRVDIKPMQVIYSQPCSHWHRQKHTPSGSHAGFCLLFLCLCGTEPSKPASRPASKPSESSESPLYPLSLESLASNSPGHNDSPTHAKCSSLNCVPVGWLVGAGSHGGWASSSDSSGVRSLNSMRPASEQAKLRPEGQPSDRSPDLESSVKSELLSKGWEWSRKSLSRMGHMCVFKPSSCGLCQNVLGTYVNGTHVDGTHVQDHTFKAILDVRYVTSEGSTVLPLVPKHVIPSNPSDCTIFMTLSTWVGSLES